MHSTQIRQNFLDFFAAKSHHIVPSSSLVPSQDPSLLFTNAGMVQFKEIFLGLEAYPHSRAASIQRCVRAGGKHNDLENVGYTARHHTFFEMLGNFSFGDYFKYEAIAYAWEFLTKILQLPTERLWVTVYEEDKEAEDIWLKEIRIDAKRFSRCGMQDNFWSMGDTGPCGPCTEIFYDHGPEILGGPPGSPEADGDRYVEIWNLVFMQYNKDAKGQLTPLPKPSVDTGMGLERIAAVVQGVHNNYDTDLFRSLLLATAELSHTQDLQATSLRVIADHIRSISFLIMDGVIPSNEGRGYVLRRIIRRAVRHGFHLGLQEPFLYRLVTVFAQQMKCAYPELVKAQARIEQVLQGEEAQFARTLEQGLQILEKDIARLSNKIIHGSTLFKLYDTYGFPVDLTADIARERGLTVDYDGFKQEMERQRQQSQRASQFQAYSHHDTQVTDPHTHFIGYSDLQAGAKVLGIYRQGKPVQALKTGEQGSVLLDKTPFYGESGGQVGDKGWLKNQDAIFEVKDTKSLGARHILHEGVVQSGTLHSQAQVMAEVDAEKRRSTALNHSATHLLHAALRKILGEHVLQKGSLVEPNRLRFDFTHPSAITAEELNAVEQLVNQQIRANLKVDTEIMALEHAKSQGVLALFDEKYADNVRVLRMGDFSQELCGGTHVQQTGDIGLFKIVAESGIASGIRRIEAFTGEVALQWLNQKQAQLSQLSDILKADPDNVLERIKQLQENNRRLAKQIEQLQLQVLNSQAEAFINQAQTISEVKVLAIEVLEADAKVLRSLLEILKQRLPKAVIVLGSALNGKVNLLASVDVAGFHAGKIIEYIAPLVAGKGGGRADLAQAGGNDPSALKQAIQEVYRYIAEQSQKQSQDKSKMQS